MILESDDEDEEDESDDESEMQFEGEFDKENAENSFVSQPSPVNQKKLATRTRAPRSRRGKAVV